MNRWIALSAPEPIFQENCCTGMNAVHILQNAKNVKINASIVKNIIVTAIVQCSASSADNVGVRVKSVTIVAKYKKKIEIYSRRKYLIILL